MTGDMTLEPRISGVGGKTGSGRFHRWVVPRVWHLLSLAEWVRHGAAALRPAEGPAAEGAFEAKGQRLVLCGSELRCVVSDLWERAAEVGFGWKCRTRSEPEPVACAKVGVDDPRVRTPDLEVGVSVRVRIPGIPFPLPVVRSSCRNQFYVPPEGNEMRPSPVKSIASVLFR